MHVHIFKRLKRMVHLFPFSVILQKEQYYVHFEENHIRHTVAYWTPDRSGGSVVFLDKTL